MSQDSPNVTRSALKRRSFLKNAGGAAAALAGVAAVPGLARAQSSSYTPSPDSPADIFTAALIAEDVATVFYYQGLRGGVIQDPNLAGPGGSFNHITTGSAGNVAYLRAALTEEIQHAKLFRGLLYGPKAMGDVDPVQTIYFPTGTFDTLTPFINMLQTLEQIFISAYMVAVREFSPRWSQRGSHTPSMASPTPSRTSSTSPMWRRRFWVSSRSTALWAAPSIRR